MTTRKELVAVARGDKPADIVITNVKLVNTLTKTLDSPVDIGICGDKIAFVLPGGSGYMGITQIDGSGLIAAPGFIDGHVHNESSMCTPSQWAKTIVPLGTTTVFTDPHEIGNVLGLRGIKYMLSASQNLPLRYFVTAPSCVPAVPGVETAGAVITSTEMEELLSWKRVVAVAEAMDYIGLINQKGNITPIVEVGHKFDVPIEGHAPMLTGNLLQAYLAATGPRASDHESLGSDEMFQKMSAGMMVYARYSTFLDTTIELVKALNKMRDHRYAGFCTDDIMPHHLKEYGHLNHGMKAMIEKDLDPLLVYQMASLNVAQHYYLSGLGAIAPSWFADIVLLTDLEKVEVRDVIQNGQLVVRNWEWQISVEEPLQPLLENTVHIPPVTADSFRLRISNSSKRVGLNSIDMSQLLTQKVVVEAEIFEGEVKLGPNQALAAIVPRHGQNTPPSLALVSNYQLQKGAIGSTISHDSHNMTIIGKDPEDMFLVSQRLVELGGGLVAVKDGNVIAEVPLPIAGLMSPLPVVELAKQMQRFETVMPELGLPVGFPFHVISLAIPVFPSVRLTDKGLVDVESQQFIPLLV